MDRPITYAEAGRLLGDFDDERVRLAVETTSDPLNFERDEECDGLARKLADDLECELSSTPQPVLALLRARILFAIGVCDTRPNDVIGHVPQTASNDDVLRGLLGVQIAGTRLPWQPGEDG